MKKILGIALVWFCMIGVSWGAAPGDLNGDGAVGIPEAIHALQVASGVRQPQGTTPYDLAEYTLIPGTLELRQTNYANGAAPYTAQGMSVVGKETVDGQEFFVDGMDYYKIDPQGVFYSGYKSGSEMRWNNPAVMIGSRSMLPGDVFTSFWLDSVSGTPSFRDTAFLGVEDVTTPAGTFTGCLKMLEKRQTTTSVRSTLTYYARGVGRVKQMRLISYLNPSNWSGYTSELVSAKIGTTVIPANVVYYAGGGVWNRTVNGEPSGSGSFTWKMSLPNLPAWGSVTLVGFNTSPSAPDFTMSLASDDGTHFSASWYTAVATDFNVTIGGGTITGTFVPTPGTTVTLGGSYSVAP